jgi:site-specific recombinase XerD
MEIQTLCQMFYDYSTSIRGYSSDTIRRYKFTIEYYCKFAHITNIEQVSTENVRALFFNGRSERKWTVNTFLVYHRSLSVFFRWCINKEFMKQKNPILEIEKPKLEKRLPSKLTKQDTLKLLEIVYNYPWHNNFLRLRNHAMFAIIIFCGLRKSELLKLKYTDVDIDNFSIFIRQGKGSKDRILPMSSTLATILKKYLCERIKHQKTCSEFFASFSQNKGLTYGGLREIAMIISKASNINFTLHKLRHSFACMMLQSGCDIYSLSKLLGHSDISTTAIYLSASADHLRLQMSKHPLNDM